MTKIVGIRFRNAGKIYYFDPNDLEMQVGDHAIVETARGVEYGTVLIAPREVEDDTVVQPLKSVVRIATEEDDKTLQRNKEREKSAYKTCQEKIAKHGLDMKLVQAEYTFDSNKLLFYFTADGRIDFRELVKDLAGVFRTRIELRQIGVRDETKMLGGIGICGRELCCCSYLSDFVPVSIKMAKEQNLSLNPTKISGVCGRLMCCLKNEQETYEYLNSRLPGIGDPVKTVDGSTGEVQSVNVLRQKVKVLVEVDDEKELREYDVEELEFQPRKKNTKVSFKELKELSGLEDEQTESADRKPEGKPEGREREKRDGRNRRERDQNRRENHENRENREPREKKDRDRNSNNNNNNNNKNQNRERRNRGGKDRANMNGNGNTNANANGKDRADRGDRANRGGENTSSESK